MVTYRKAVNWLLFLHCAFHFSPNRNSHLILHLLLMWMEPSPDTAGDHPLSASDYSKLRWVGKTVLKHHCTTQQRNKDSSNRKRKKKGKENAFSLVICFGSQKLILITPNASGSAVLQPVETGHC